MKRVAKPKLTPAAVGQRAEQLLAGAKDGARLTREQRMERARHDHAFFCEYYLADYFTRPGAAFHGELFDLVIHAEKALVSAPREHAKSTIMSFAAPLHAVCFDLAKFIVIIRDTEGVARQAVDDLRQELESNDRITEDFGQLFDKRKWTEAEFVTAKGTKVVGRGRGSSMRGLRNRQHRPDLIILDDIEDDESVNSREQREKGDNWLRRVVMNLGRYARIVWVGTPLHSDALLCRWMKRTDVFRVRRYKAITDEGKPLWPALWTLEALEKKKAEIGTRAFSSEFMDSPVNEEDQIFLAEQFPRFTDDDLAGVRLDVVAAIDPAIGLKAKNDDTAVVVMGWANGRYYLLRARLKKLKLSQQIELVTATYREFPRIQKFGFETIAYQAGLKQLVDEESVRCGLQVPAVAVDDISSDKVKRISRLQPLAQQRLILVPHVSSAYWSPDVERVLEQFADLGVSTNAHDDGPDAVERAMSLLRGRTGGGRRRMARLV